jgi:hypothetical protein
MGNAKCKSFMKTLKREEINIAELKNWRSARCDAPSIGSLGRRPF